MPSANYVLLEKITVGAAGASSVTFSGIPQTGYTDLVVKVSARSTKNTTVWDGVVATFNGSTANFSYRNLNGDGSTAYSLSASNNNVGFLEGNTATANTFSNYEMYIPNYTGSNNKSMSIDSVTENNATEAYASLHTSLWSNSAAITSIKLEPSSATLFQQYSTFYLYGVAKLGTTPAIVPYATGGDTIMTDGTYWYHTFLSSGTFTPTKAITADYLVVAGGGGGGGSYGGGGGAGGLRCTVGATGGGGSLESALALGTSAYTVTIGAGGSGGTNGALSTSGSNSVFSTITSTGGGKGADNSAAGFSAGATGGSGGGASYTYTTGGSGTANQGYAAGSGNGSVSAGSGGGGAGAVSGNVGSTNGIATNGGAGVTTSISGSSVTYGGGGGGGATVGGGAGTYAGAGGSGGGGAGSLTSGGSGTSGTANTGGGGGGSGYLTPAGAGGNGGSGIVIVRYAV